VRTAVTPMHRSLTLLAMALVCIVALAAARHRPTPRAVGAGAELRTNQSVDEVNDPGVQEDPREIDNAALRRVLRMARPRQLAPDPTNGVAESPQAARLGQLLFFDARLSANGAVSCATCHDPARSFTDGRRRGVGLSEGTRNSQGLLDIADLPWFTWDGRADSLWSQALHPFEDAREMGLTRFTVIDRIRETPDLKQEFEAVFGPLPPPVSAESATTDERVAINRTFSNVGKAIAAYERKLRTKASPFDGEVERLRWNAREPVPGFGDAERRGLKLFLSRAGCWRCHHGPALSDGSFHAIGVPPLGGGLPADRGRLDAIARLKTNEFNAAGRYSDDPSGSRAEVTLALTEEPGLWGAVRTPTLRNVSRTAPYMREGQFETLEEVIRFYSTLEGALADHHGERVLEPLALSDAEIADLVAFLKALDGPLPDEALMRPLPSARPAE